MIIKTDPQLIQSYLEDESGLRGGFSTKIFIPEDEYEAAEILRDCAARGIPLTVSGGGTGVTGGRVPFGGAVLSVERLNKLGAIRELKDGGAVITAGAGVSVKDIKDAARAAGFTYAPDPTETSSFIGGNISTNASGSRGLKFGPTRNYVERLKLVFTSGETLEVRRGEVFADRKGVLELPFKAGPLALELPSYKLPSIKNAAGYYNRAGMDLIDLFIGQEGTLALITEADLRLTPRIGKVLSGIAFFPEESKSWEFVFDIKRVSAESGKLNVQGGIDAMSLEYFDSGALELLRQDYGDIPSSARAAIFFEQAVDGDTADRAIDAWARAFEKHGVSFDSVWFGTTEREEKLFREFRHRLPEKVNEIVRRNKFPKTGTDLAVPDTNFLEMIKYYEEELRRSGIRYLVFGHIGESHIHANLLPDNERDYAGSRNTYLKLATKAVSLGGTVSAEHGIGKLKHLFLEKMLGPGGVSELASLKKSLDPSLILGQNNIFPKDTHGLR